MTIQYLTKVIENPVLEVLKNRTLSIEKIEKLEKNIIRVKNFQKPLENIYF
ncbi:hypothetical protein AB4Y90_01450 [Chryseobacterium sp. 2TAF14]|uniref:hypothetical protein n=1 Tax=Chryseobacterium sp. 2TAF14 TaxID=3233007 RepID=UPI003F8E88A1